MKSKLALLSLFFVLAVISCKKDNTDTPVDENEKITPTIYSHTLPSTAGTYWVYETYTIDSLGAATATGIYDTTWITGDTVINGRTYHIYKGQAPYAWTSYMRDSLGYILSAPAQVAYHFLADTATISSGTDAQFGHYSLMNGGLVSKTVPFGTYSTVQLQTHWYNVNQDPFTSCGDQEYVELMHIDRQIGVVARQYSFITEIQDQCKYRELRLINYYHP